MVASQQKIVWNLKPPPKLIDASNSVAAGIDFREFQIEGQGSFDYCCAVLQIVTNPFGSLKLRPYGQPDFSDAPYHGSAGIHRPGEPVRGEWQGTARLLGIYLPPSFIERVFERPCHTMEFGLPERPSAITENIMAAIRADVGQGSPGGPAFIQSAAISLLHHLNRTPNQRSPAKGGLSRRQLSILREMISGQLAGQLNLEKLAEAIHVSPGYFSRAFKVSMGLSPHQYILRVRVERAKLLIQNTNRSLNEIAEQVGFADGSHMSTVFLKVSGKAPSQFRNR